MDETLTRNILTVTTLLQSDHNIFIKLTQTAATEDIQAVSLACVSSSTYSKTSL